ncbi:MAG: glycoside hydrolase family 97 protein [Phycisphaerales bacterium]|nr:glycoside hydrolase family 97 protein [Phycisphaerales bacterium]
MTPKLRIASAVAACCLALVSSAPADPIIVESPAGVLTLTFDVQDGVPMYRVSRGPDAVIAPSRLGFQLRGGRSLCDGLKVITTKSDSNDTTWVQPWGEEKEIRDRHRELRVELGEIEGGERRLNIIFRVFDDGIGFRYEIPKQAGLDKIEIDDELTQFAMTGDHQTWWVPAFEHNRYEYAYSKTPLHDVRKVHTPFTMATEDGLYLSIHEAALTDFASMALWRKDGLTLEADLVPWSDGIKVKGTAPMVSPWRTVQVADSPGGLIESHLILNLNEPSEIHDTSWIKPGKYVGIWWEMHLGISTWGSGPKHGATTKNTKRYIDFAADNGFDGVLVEGWNVGWDGDWMANADKFSFTKPYPDYDLQELAEYAREKGVTLIGHHETAGGIDSYERQMEDAFALLEKLGVRAVKTGYVAHGQSIKRIDENGKEQREWHHGQYMVRHYRKVVECAARHHVMLDVHEPIKDTGIRRTWPNMMTREGACGQEFNAWGGEKRNKPNHTTILPFTRLLAGPMDFTPGIFDVLFEKYNGDNRVSTTVAKQLALYVVLYSPLQMAADLPENYLARPEPFQFIKDVPTDWKITKVLNGEIGEYVTIARQDRNSNNWYVGSITNEKSRDFDIALDFLAEGHSYKAQIYHDGEGADWKTNPLPVTIDKKLVTSSDSLRIKLAPGGGTAIRLEQID